MFSIVNEIKDNSPPAMVRVVSASIGSAAGIYILVAITGYITFGNTIVGNIILMCKFFSPLYMAVPTSVRSSTHPF